MDFHKARALDKKVNAGTGRRLTKREQAHKMRNWPRGGEVDVKEQHRLMGKDS